MSFKIVKSFEKGVYRHWIVPSSWEHNNIVKWPKKNSAKLVKSIDSVPEPDWRHIKCQVKRANIPTYEDAERELSILLNVTDTDEDHINERITKSNQKVVNMNSAMEQLANQYNPPEISVPEESYESSSQIIFSSNDQILDIPTNTYCVLAADQEHFIEKPQENYDLQKILENINLVLESHDRKMDAILENQKKIINKMACLSVQFDNVQLQLGDFNKDHVDVLSAATKNKVENMTFSICPITTVEELTEMNNTLSDKTARKRLKETLSVVCSAGKGINCAYKLVDTMFSRDFLCQCSWSGFSRSDGVKYSFKSYKNVLSFFWELIFQWDQTFTVQDNELFFKSILKNSNKRKNAKQERLSTTRKRTKIEKIETITKPNDGESNTENVVVPASGDESTEEESLC